MGITITKLKPSKVDLKEVDIPSLVKEAQAMGRTDLTYKVIRSRLVRGWSMEETLKRTAPPRKRQSPRKKGAACAKSKLSEVHVIDMLRQLRSGRSISEVAKEFGVAPGTVYDIARGKTWKPTVAKNGGPIVTRNTSQVAAAETASEEA